MKKVIFMVAVIATLFVSCTTKTPEVSTTPNDSTCVDSLKCDTIIVDSIILK